MKNLVIGIAVATAVVAVGAAVARRARVVW